MLLLGTGHCFRDQVLEVCPELSRYSAASEGIARTFEGSSLETIRHMVAAGIGITVLPTSSLSMPSMQSDLLAYIPRSEEHTSELQSLMRTSYAVFFLKNKHIQTRYTNM